MHKDKTEYEFGKARNPVNDALLGVVASKLFAISDKSRQVRKLMNEISELDKTVTSAVNDSKQFGYSDEELIDAIGDINVPLKDKMFIIKYNPHKGIKEFLKFFKELD